MEILKENTTPRSDLVNKEVAFNIIQEALQDIPKVEAMIRNEPAKLLQTRTKSIASDYERIAFFAYAIGYPIEYVREAFAFAAEYELKVFKLRGTEPPFPAYSLTYDPQYPPGTPESIVEYKKINPDEFDYSLTNSRAALMAFYYGYLSGQYETAEKIAELIWDPEKSRYIGPRAYCTMDHHHLAYSLRSYLAGDEDSANARLKKIFPRKGNQSVFLQSRMLKAILEKNPEEFLDSNQELIAYQKKWQKRKISAGYPEFYLCTESLGLSELAVRRGLFNYEDLPQGDSCSPVELITL
ncbi:hypothetical protein [uncultured Gimesia sp.]|uniref:hypothetical protein n=1 Tax=uncultured Gimesia sp. TaxID=1678688 RepID=UPI0030D8DD0D|tara:strand:- start:90 stop:980 length:891 start_codon:yes stop_codon:yes gene_type:complete